jgi:phosphoglycolate phosphatase
MAGTPAAPSDHVASVVRPRTWVQHQQQRRLSLSKDQCGSYTGGPVSQSHISGRAVLVLWDVDHTLIENGGVSKENYQKAFETLTGRHPEHPVETDGRTDPEIIRNMLASHGVTPEEPYLSGVAEALESAMIANMPRLRECGYELPGARAALSTLVHTPGVVQSVLSGNIRANAFAKLSAFGLDSYIDFDVGGYGSDDKVRANLVEVARGRALAKYSVSFNQSTTVLVGDTTRDVRAGLDGGTYVVAVASGIDSVEQLRADGANVVFPDLCDTRAIVEVVRGLQGTEFQGAKPN